MDDINTKLRAFIGIPLDETIRQLLSEPLATLKAQLNKNISKIPKPAPKIPWVKPENWHRTLAFLGQISEDEASYIKHLLANSLATTKSFTAELEAIGDFPYTNGPIIAAVLGNNAAFQKLYEQIQEVCKIAGLRQEHRTFNPHITLARIKTPIDRKHKSHRPGKPPGEFLVPHVQLDKVITLDRVQLFKSYLSPEGSRYENLAEFLLPS